MRKFIIRERSTIFHLHCIPMPFTIDSKLTTTATIHWNPWSKGPRTHSKNMTQSKNKTQTTVLKEHQIHDTSITATKHHGITTAPTDSYNEQHLCLRWLRNFNSLLQTRNERLTNDPTLEKGSKLKLAQTESKIHLKFLRSEKRWGM